MKKIITCLLATVAVLSMVWVLLPQSARMSIVAVLRVGGMGIVAEIEKQVDEGQLALEHVDAAYRQAEQKLIQLKALKMDAAVSLEQAENRVADYEKRGRTDLAAKNRQQVDFFRKQFEGYDRSIVSRTQKLEEIGVLRSRAREDVRLVREKVAYLRATRDALDSEGQRETLEHVDQLINQMHQSCNRLTAEVEVLNMEE